jgi:hypothetical protein
MKNKINLRLTYFALFLISAMTIFIACTKEEVSTSAVLSVFGPSPALRGGELKFIGTNLDKVTAIDLNGTAEISTFVSKSSTEIVITVPQDAKPGTVTLKSPTGDITTKTPLTFSEPISIDATNGYTTTAVKAGDVFTINGDYLNLIAQVIFNNGAVVDSSNFVSQSRKKIEVKVPKTAKTGKVAISNGATIPVLVYTSGNATIADPTTLTSIAPIPVKPGANLTITGTYLDLIKSVILPDGNKIDSAAITINGAKTQIVVKVPSSAKEGDVKVITYSDTQLTAPQQLKLVAPAITSVSPMLVKNGATVTVTGTNLDLVTGASFNGISCTLGTLSSDNKTLAISVPLTATDGTIVLSTNSGLTAISAALTMVKPTFTSISPMSLTAGDKVTINGTDLDLVNKIDFLGGSVAVTPASGATSLTVTVPTTCVGTGSVTFETVNGTKVVSTDQLAIKASTTPAIISITPAVAPGGLMTITGKNLNFVESIVFETGVKAVLYGVRTATTIEVYVPVTAKHGSTTFTMNSFVGEQIVSPSFVYGTDPILSSTIMITNFDGGGNSQSTWGGSFTFGTPTVNLNETAAMIGKSGVTTSWDWLWAANWGAIPSLANPEKYVVKMDVCITKPVSGITMGLCLKGWDIAVNLGDVFGATTNGQWVTMTFDVLKSGMAIDGTKDWGLYISGASATYDFSGIMIDNLRFDLKSSPSSSPKFRLIGM